MLIDNLNATKEGVKLTINNEKVVERFWLAMSEIYGKRWFMEYGETPPDMWRGAIASLSIDRIKATLEVCRDAGDAHPVTLSQFMGRAKGIRLRPEPEHLALPKPKTADQKENYRKSLQLIREALSEKNKKKSRSVLLRGEDYPDYKQSLGQGLSQGKSLFQLKWERLKKNGWTEDDELALYNQARICNYNLYAGTTNLLIDLHETEL